MPELRLIAAALVFCSSACAGADAGSGASASNGTQAPTRLEQPRAAASATAQLADDPDPEVVGGGERPISEGSNTNWRPTEPWLDSPRRRGAEPANGRKPSDGRGNLDPAPDPDEASTPPEQQSGSSSSDPSSGSNATPDPS